MERDEELEGRKHVCRVGYLWLDFSFFFFAFKYFVFLVKSVNVIGFGKNSSTFLRAAPCDMTRDITFF